MKESGWGVCTSPPRISPRKPGSTGTTSTGQASNASGLGRRGQGCWRARKLGATHRRPLQTPQRYVFIYKHTNINLLIKYFYSYWYVVMCIYHNFSHYYFMYYAALLIFLSNHIYHWNYRLTVGLSARREGR